MSESVWIRNSFPGHLGGLASEVPDIWSQWGSWKQIYFLAYLWRRLRPPLWILENMVCPSVNLFISTQETFPAERWLRQELGCIPVTGVPTDFRLCQELHFVAIVVNLRVSALCPVISPWTGSTNGYWWLPPTSPGARTAVFWVVFPTSCFSAYTEKILKENMPLQKPSMIPTVGKEKVVVSVFSVKGHIQNPNILLNYL